MGLRGTCAAWLKRRLCVVGIRDSSRVKELTGICRFDIADADSLGKVLVRFLDWAGSAAPVRFVAWSRNDYKQLAMETRFKDMPFAMGKMR